MSIDWIARAQALTPRVQNFIGGRWQPDGNHDAFEKYGPRDGSLLYRFGTQNAFATNEAVESARLAFDDGRWSRLSVQQRKDVLHRLAALIDCHREELALLECLDVGKPISDALSFDVPVAANIIRHNADAADHVYGKVYAADSTSLSYELRRPLGVVAGIIGWNFPVVLAAQKIAPALATGNSLVLKPSEITSLSAAEAAQRPSFMEHWPQLWAYRKVAVPLLLTRIMVWIADGAVFVWGAPTFARKFALSPDRIGAIMAAALLVAGILGPILAGPLADLCQRTGGPRRTITALCLLMLASVPAGVFGIMPDVTLASIAMTAFLAVGFMINVAAFAVASIVLPGEVRSVYFGVTFTVAALVGLGVAPLIVSGLTGLLGGPATLGTALAIVCAATSILGTLLFGFTRRYFPRDRRELDVPASCG